MKTSFSKFFFAFFLLFVVFSDEIFYGYMAASGTAVESGMKSIEAILIAIVAYSLMLVDFMNKRITRRNIWQLLVLLIILLLYVITGYRYFPPQRLYHSYLLTYGSYSIPAAYVGMRLARTQDFSVINRILPYFVIPLTIVIGLRQGSFAMENELVRHDASGLNYQNISYFMSFFYTYSVYYVFFSGIQHKGIYRTILKYLMVATMFLSAIFCLIGGGRGAFVYIIFITILLLYSLFKAYERRRGYITVLVFILGLVFVLLVDRFNVLESTGLERVTQYFSDDDTRLALWNAALEFFYQSPVIGWGLGSIWWTVGFYSHNILTDLLAETGLIGTLIVVVSIVIIFFRSYKLFMIDKSYLFVLLVFLGALVLSTFSGYWIAAHNLFFAFGFIYAINWKKQL